MPVQPAALEVVAAAAVGPDAAAIIKKAIRVYNAGPQADQADDGWSLDETLMDGRAGRPTPRCWNRTTCVRR